MNQVFSKPLDIAFYIGILIIVLQVVFKRIKPANKEKINNTLRQFQNRLKAIQFGSLITNFEKYRFFTLIILLNGLICSYVAYRIFQHQMALDGKEAPVLRFSDLTFIGCLMILLVIIGEVLKRFRIKDKKKLTSKVIEALLTILLLIILIILVLSIFDLISRFSEESGLPSLILRGAGAVLVLFFISGVIIMVLLQIIVFLLALLRKTYVLLFPADGDALEVAFITIVGILGVIKMFAGYI